MQIETLKVFRDLSDTESFTKAAERNGITQSAVSQQINALERHFAAPLIERSRKRFRLTPEGEVLREYSQQIVTCYGELQVKIDEARNVVTGSIRIATIYSIGLHELPPYVRQFLHAHPTVNIQVEYRRVNQVYEDVLSNAVDLGLLAYPTHDPRLTVIPLRKDPMVLVCHPQHPLAANAIAPFAALNGLKFIAFEPDIPTRQAIDKTFHAHDIRVDTVMELDNIETVKRAVEIDAGVSIIPRSTIQQELEKGTLREVRLDNGDLYRPLAVIHRSKKVLTPAMKAFVAILQGNNPTASEGRKPRTTPRRMQRAKPREPATLTQAR